MADGTTTARMRRWHHRLPGPARLLLGILLLAMAVGQLSDMAGFARVLDGYRLLPQWMLTPAAWGLAAAEATAGMTLLRHRRRGALLAVGIAVAWTLLTVQAFGRGLVLDNCGCFGVHLGQPLRWWVLIEDAQFVALAVWVWRSERRTPRLPDHRAGDRPEPDRRAAVPTA